MPMPGSASSVRRIRSAASSVPSATQTWPACSERPMPTPPPWWKETHEAPVAVAEPADAGREALEGDPLAGELDPAPDVVLVAEQVEHRPVGRGDVGRV